MPTLPVHLTDFSKEKPAQVKASFVYERRKAQGRVSQKTIINQYLAVRA
jgi:hypothetical protein